VAAKPDTRVSVVVPVWDDYVGPHLAEAVESLRAQGHPFRLIVVDNASTKPVPALDDAEVVRTPERLTTGAARNFGVRHVDTPYVIFWDADDLMLPGTIRMLVEAMDADPGLVAFAAGIVDGSTGRRYRWPRRWPFAFARFPRLFAFGQSVWALFPTTGASIMRTEAVREAGFGDNDAAEDWILGASLAFRGRVGFTRRFGRIYRQHPGSIWTGHDSLPLLLEDTIYVRERLRADPAVPRWAKLLRPAVATAQYACLLTIRPVMRGLRSVREPFRKREAPVATADLPTPAPGIEEPCSDGHASTAPTPQ